MENSIKSQAKELFSKKNYQEAIDTLLKLGIDDFVSYAHKFDKKNNKDCWFKDALFCSKLAESANLFNQVFKSDFADELLFSYYSYSEFLPEFEAKLADSFPDLFINSVRATHSFLQKDRLSHYSSFDFPELGKNHLMVWKNLSEIDEKQWQRIEALLDNTLKSQKIKIESLLFEIVFWLENSRFQNQSQKHINHLSSVYNFLVGLVFDSYSLNSFLSNNDNVDELFYKSLLSLGQQKELTDLFEAISNWVHFRDTTLYPYCFDHTITPVVDGGVVCFNRTPLSYYKWELDGVRYNLNNLSYNVKGREITEELNNQNPTRIPGITEVDKQKNYELDVSKWQQTLFMKDLNVDSFIFQGKEIPIEDIATALLSYSKNRLYRYELEISENYSTSRNWLEAYLKLCQKSVIDGVARLPYVCLSKQEYCDLNKHAIEQIPQTATDNILNLFSYRKGRKSYFDRFRWPYDVWKKPFLIIGEYLFCPMMFFANNDWFYTFAQASLENLDKYALDYQKKSSTNMENYLASCFHRKGWTSKAFTDQEANKIEGDVDVAINDGETTLLIQLKRTYFRLNLKDSFSEYINVDRKAAQQLNDAFQFLSSDKNIFKIGSDVSKWIVTTSYENILSDINNCIKVNYFDLIQALLNPELKRLNDLIKFIEDDNILRNWLKVFKDEATPQSVKDLIYQSGLPLQLVDPQRYITPIFVKDKTSVEYTSKYNKAIELKEKGFDKKAIRILKSCISENPNDYQAWEAIANAYANTKDFPKALECFEKALFIVPNDPYILRNYAITHREKGDFKKYYSIVEKLQSKYWFLQMN